MHLVKFYSDSLKVFVYTWPWHHYFFLSGEEPSWAFHFVLHDDHLVIFFLTPSNTSKAWSSQQSAAELTLTPPGLLSCTLLDLHLRCPLSHLNLIEVKEWHMFQCGILNRVDFTKMIHCVQSCQGTLMVAQIYLLYFLTEILINQPERGETCKDKARARSRVFSRNAARLETPSLPI